MNRVVFENDVCVVINKLPGESAELPEAAAAAASDGTDCALKSGREGELFPVHRLDTPVSGCLLLAKTPDAAAFLGAAFARNDETVKKRYWAIVEMPSEKTFPPKGELVHWICENRKANKSFAVSEACQTGKEDTPERKGRTRFKKAVLRYSLAGKGEHYLFLEIDLVTGRHHQIRAQLAALGLHVKGDLKYGARRSDKAGIRLHAYSLAFPNPLNPGEIIETKAMPPVMDSLWEAFAEAVDIR